jgi:hypothetical protein
VPVAPSSPAIAGAEEIDSRSRDAFFDSHPSYEQPVPKNLAALLTFVRSIQQWKAGSITVGRGTEEKKARKQNAERRNFTNLRTCKARRASSGTRTPSGVPLWLLSKGLSSQELSFGPGFPERSADRWRGYPAGAGPGYSDAPRVPVMVPAGMMCDAAREQR